MTVRDEMLPLSVRFTPLRKFHRGRQRGSQDENPDRPLAAATTGTLSWGVWWVIGRTPNDGRCAGGIAQALGVRVGEERRCGTGVALMRNRQRWVMTNASIADLAAEGTRPCGSTAPRTFARDKQNLRTGRGTSLSARRSARHQRQPSDAPSRPSSFRCRAREGADRGSSDFGRLGAVAESAAARRHAGGDRTCTARVGLGIEGLRARLDDPFTSLHVATRGGAGHQTCVPHSWSHGCSHPRADGLPLLGCCRRVISNWRRMLRRRAITVGRALPARSSGGQSRVSADGRELAQSVLKPWCFCDGETCGSQANARPTPSRRAVLEFLLAARTIGMGDKDRRQDSYRRRTDNLRPRSVGRIAAGDRALASGVGRQQRGSWLYMKCSTRERACVALATAGTSGRRIEARFNLLWVSGYTGRAKCLCVICAARALRACGKHAAVDDA